MKVFPITHMTGVWHQALLAATDQAHSILPMGSYILGIGVDVVSVEPFSSERLSSSLEQLLFTEAEQACWTSDVERAGCFAIKEAVVKAVGGGLIPPQVEVLTEVDGRIGIRLQSRRGEKIRVIPSVCVGMATEMHQRKSQEHYVFACAIAYQAHYGWKR